MQKIEEIYAQYAKQVYKYLFCLTRDENLAEELTQETFYIAVKKIGRFRGECKLYVWLCQIAKHLYYKQLKKHKRITILPLDTIENKTILQENMMENHSINKLDIYQKIDKLEERTREVLYLRIMGDFSFKQIAEMLDISENLARVIFYRGKQKIKESDFYEKE